MSTRRVVFLILAILLILASATALQFLLDFHAIDDSYFDHRHSNRVNVDLLAEAERALVETETALITFGSPESESHYDEPDPRQHLESIGFRTIRDPEGKSCAAVVGNGARVRFTALSRGARSVTVEGTGIADGQGSQQVEVRLNGVEEPVATFELKHSDQAEQHSFRLPGEQIRKGSNYLEFSFARLMPWRIQSEGMRYAIGAIFSRMEIRHEQLAVAAEAHAGPDLDVQTIRSVGGRPARPSLVFWQGSRVSFAMKLPDGRPRLATSVHVHPDDVAARCVHITVRLRAEPAGELLVLKAALDASSDARNRRPIDIDADLSVFRDSVVSIEFEAESPSPGETPFRIVAAEPAVKGGDLRPATEAPASSGLEKLRDRLKQRNLVLITLDAAAADHFTAYGAGVEYAPNVDVLARDGVVFEATTSPASYTLASVGSMFTGLLPDSHGVVASGTSEGGVRLSDQVPTLAEHLADAGYTTLAMVTNPNAGSQYGYDRGFQVYDALYDRSEGLWDEGVEASALAPRLEKHLSEGGLQEPYFLYLHVFQPHAPYRPPRRVS